MKVNDIKEVRELPEAAPVKPTKPVSEAEDRVSTSASFELSQAVESARMELAGSRAVRVKELEAAVKQGLYRPDAKRLAEEILNAAELNARLRAMLKR